MDSQCNFCGAFDNLMRCPHCKSFICARCKVGHEPICETNTRMRNAGAGATVKENRADTRETFATHTPFINQSLSYQEQQKAEVEDRERAKAEARAKQHEALRQQVVELQSCQ